MAQVLEFKHNGAVTVNKGVPVLGSTWDNTTVLIMKTKNIKMSIDGSVMFPFDYDESTVNDITSSYIFNNDCIITYGKKVTI